MKLLRRTPPGTDGNKEILEHFPWKCHCDIYLHTWIVFLTDAPSCVYRFSGGSAIAVTRSICFCGGTALVRNFLVLVEGS